MEMGQAGYGLRCQWAARGLKISACCHNDDMMWLAVTSYYTSSSITV